MDADLLIVIGASAGGIEALITLAKALPAELRTPICVVVHTTDHVPNLLPRVLSRLGARSAREPEDGERLQAGGLYVATPDRHLLVNPGRLRIWDGPPVNRVRPAINPLFWSAAHAYGPRVSAVLLSGVLDDGVEGLATIKRRGGITLVQDPEEAVFRDLPDNAIRQVAIDHVLPARELAAVLARLSQQPRFVQGNRQERENETGRQPPIQPTDPR